MSVLFLFFRGFVVRRRQRVFSGKTAGADRQVVDDLREAFETKVAEGIGTDDAADLIDISVVGDELLS